MESALMRIMKPEVDRYAEERVKEALTEKTKDMLKSGCTDEFVMDIMQLTKEEVRELRAGIGNE